MSELDDESVNLIITSPPYWSLKDYGTEDQIGFGSGSFEKYLQDLKQGLDRMRTGACPGRQNLHQHNAVFAYWQSCEISATRNTASSWGY